MSQETSEIVYISKAKFLAGCAVVAVALLASGPLPTWLVALEVFLTIISLFVFGSMKYQIDKNALTYGGALVILATFWTQWWPESSLHAAVLVRDFERLRHFFFHYFLTLHGLDQLFHADTMLFILGLTFFVSMIAQTRVLETVSFQVLRKMRGGVLPTVAILTGIVAFASGILDGVSMIGLMIRTMVIILLLGKAKDSAVIFSVVVSTVVTTVCGMWLAYGEPPNLIMKANLHPHLDNAFFLRYCLPAAVGSYLVVFWNLRKYLGKDKIDLSQLDILDAHTADVRFLQASRHGEVLLPHEFIEAHTALLGDRLKAVEQRLHHGEPLGNALVAEGVPEAARREILGKFIDEDLADELDYYYAHARSKGDAELERAKAEIARIFKSISAQRVRSQVIGGLSFVPFIGFLIWHAVDHTVPLFWASFAGFAVASFGIFPIAKMRNLALHEAKHEYVEYLFLFPLFLSITLLQKTGFFDQLATLLHQGIEKFGASHMAYAQFLGATFLSAILDNNVVADFTSRALHNLDLAILHLFSMAQIAGYAAGGCWTHIGSAQSVVAYAFIRKEVDERFTPFQWIRVMTPIILQIALLMTLIVYGEGLLLKFLH